MGITELNRQKQDLLKRVYEENPCTLCKEADLSVIRLYRLYTPRPKVTSSGYIGLSQIEAIMTADDALVEVLRKEIGKCVMLCANCILRIKAGKSTVTEIDRVYL